MAISTWKIWCEWPHRSNRPGFHTSGMRVYSSISITRHLSRLFTDSVNCNGSQIQKYSDSVTIGPGLNFHLAVFVEEASIDDGVESRGSHEREQKPTKGSPCRFSKSSYKQDKDCRRELCYKINLVKSQHQHHSLSTRRKSPLRQSRISSYPSLHTETYTTPPAGSTPQ